MSDSLDDAADRIESALDRVETAIKEKWSDFQWIIIIIVGIWLWSVPGDMWHSKWRYTWAYDIPETAVYVQKEPHDCSFLAAPIGEKYCHYDRTVSFTRWATSQANTPIVSYDDGKTWSDLEPGGKQMPKVSTVEEVVINWEKKED